MNQLKRAFQIVVLIVLAAGCSKVSERSISGQFINEPENPKPIWPAQQWNKLKGGINADWGSTNVRYRKDYIPWEMDPAVLEITGWKNERISAQMVIWSKDTVSDITIEVDELKSETAAIDTGAVRIFYIRNVLTDEFLSGCGPKTKTLETAYLHADAFESLKVYNHPGKTARGVWFNIDIPKNASPGKYNGKANLLVNGRKKAALKFSVNVIDNELPDPAEWKFHLDLWQNPFAFIRVHNIELWSEKHFEVMKPYYQMLANAGQKCVTATITHRPWGGQTLDPYDSMVKRSLMSDGSWEFDFTHFDQWVDFMKGLGIDQQINCYTLITKDGKYYYYDAVKNENIVLELIPGTTDYEMFWTPFLKAFGQHLSQKGILYKTTIAMEEHPPQFMVPVIHLIKKHLPEIKITLALDMINDYSEDIYDLSIGLKHLHNKEIISERNARNVLTTFYVSCSSAYPNNFTFSSPAEGVWMGWFAYANGMCGFLRWAYNSWVEEPIVDSRFRTWPSGDAYLVYPGPRSSIRFEKIRQGIQDFEKMRLITECLSKSDNSENRRMLQELSDHLEYYKTNFPQENSIRKSIERSGQLINEISAKMN